MIGSIHFRRVLSGQIQEGISAIKNGTIKDIIIQVQLEIFICQRYNEKQDCKNMQK